MRALFVRSAPVDRRDNTIVQVNVSALAVNILVASTFGRLTLVDVIWLTPASRLQLFDRHADTRFTTFFAFCCSCRGGRDRINVGYRPRSKGGVGVTLTSIIQNQVVERVVQHPFRKGAFDVALSDAVNFEMKRAKKRLAVAEQDRLRA